MCAWALLMAMIGWISCYLAIDGTIYAAEESEKIAVDPTASGQGYASVLYDNTNGLPTSDCRNIGRISLDWKL